MKLISIKRFTAFFTALCAVLLLLPRLDIPAGAARKYVEFCGIRILSDAEALCFYTDTMELGEKIAKVEAEYDTNGDFSKVYVLPGDTEIDIAELAEKFPNIKRLAFVRGKLKNTGAFAKIKDLTKLDIHLADPRDMSFLNDIGKNLKLFRYNNVYCEDITPLKNLKNVKELALTLTARAGDPTEYIKKFTKLKKLKLDSGAVKNADFLSGLSGLTSLEFDECANLGDISALKKLTGLKTLTVSTRVNGIDLSPIKKLTKLEDLTLGQGGTDISVISGLKSLKKLYLHNYGDNRLITVSKIKNAVKKLTGLESFTVLSCGSIGDLNFLSKHKKLTELTLMMSGVSDVSGLKDLTGLKKLSIIYNNLGTVITLDISPLKKLKGLTALELTSTPVKDISVIKNMPELEYLSLSETYLSDLSPIMHLEKLKSLNVRGCGDEKTIEKFHKAHPDCEIIPEYDDDEYLYY